MPKPSCLASTAKVTGLPPGRYEIEIGRDRSVSIKILEQLEQPERLNPATRLSNVLNQNVLRQLLNVSNKRVTFLQRKLNDLFANQAAFSCCTVADFCQRFTERDLKTQAGFQEDEVKKVSDWFFKHGHVLHER